MNSLIRKRALQQNMSPIAYFLQQVNAETAQSGVYHTIFAACPNSLSVIKAALRSAKRNNAPIKFAATLNQVDLDGGYTGLTQQQFVDLIRLEAQAINYTGFVMIAIDHGGPWLKDMHSRGNLSYSETLDAVKRSFEAAIEAGYDLIHVDPTIDITLNKGETIDIDVVAQRTIDLIVHTENFRRNNNYPRIAYEVGTEEVHGGLADMSVFTRFLDLLKTGLQENDLEDVWPCFVVGKVGTDLHTTTFDAEVARSLTATVARYGSLIKGHYSDNVINPEDYPLSRMGAANVGPEFTELEYDGVMELCEMEERLLAQHRIAKSSGLKAVLWKAVIDSGRWKKWLLPSESPLNFYDTPLARQTWLVKTGCRYIWENAEVLAVRSKLYKNIEQNGIDAEGILLAHIEKAMDKYFRKFNLVDLHDLVIKEKLPELVY